MIQAQKLVEAFDSAELDDINRMRIQLGLGPAVAPDDTIDGGQALLFALRQCLLMGNVDESRLGIILGYYKDDIVELGNAWNPNDLRLTATTLHILDGRWANLSRVSTRGYINLMTGEEREEIRSPITSYGISLAALFALVIAPLSDGYLPLGEGEPQAGEEETLAEDG